jgi:cytoskeleton protein RodZ
MTDSREAADTVPQASSAGALLKAARQAQGLHIAALATQLKVSPRKLEALEADRHDELQGPTFVRALALAACRTLRIEPAPVLALLPSAAADSLGDLGGGLNEPFRERSQRREPIADTLGGSRWLLPVVGLLLTGAALMWWWPRGGVSLGWPADASAPAAAAVADAPSAPASVAPVAVAALPPTTLPPVAASAAPALAPPASAVPSEPVLPRPDHLLQLRVQAASWVEVTDGAGQSLISRTLQPGEAVDLDGALPLRVKIGNVSATEVRLRGQVVDLTSATRDNVARLELK